MDIIQPRCNTKLALEQPCVLLRECGSSARIVVETCQGLYWMGRPWIFVGVSEWDKGGMNTWWMCHPFTTMRPSNDEKDAPIG